MGELLDASSIYKKSVRMYAGNLDDINEPGLFRLSSGATGFPSVEKPYNDMMGFLLESHVWDNNTRAQILYPKSSFPNGPAKILKRSTSGGVWGSWYMFIGTKVE